jgi:hypothetical protein
LHDKYGILIILVLIFRGIGIVIELSLVESAPFGEVETVLVGAVATALHCHHLNWIFLEFLARHG